MNKWLSDEQLMEWRREDGEMDGIDPDVIDQAIEANRLRVGLEKLIRNHEAAAAIYGCDAEYADSKDALGAYSVETARVQMARIFIEGLHQLLEVKK